MSIRYEEHSYGFNYGAADITRIHSDDNKGWIILQLKTPKKQLQIYVTKTGKVRIFDELESGKEVEL
jgi:hypothetical protein